MFLVTGPTGSGKTVSLYTGINILNKADLLITIGLDGWDIIRPFKANVPIVSIDSIDSNDRTFQPVTIGLEGNMAHIIAHLKVICYAQQFMLRTDRRGSCCKGGAFSDA